MVPHIRVGQYFFLSSYGFLSGVRACSLLVENHPAPLSFLVVYELVVGRQFSMGLWHFCTFCISLEDRGRLSLQAVGRFAS